MKQHYDPTTGLPTDPSYLESGLPRYPQESLDTMKQAQAEKDSGKRDLRFDCYYCDLQADINSAEVDGRISSEQAWYYKRDVSRLGRRIRQLHGINER